MRITIAVGGRFHADFMTEALLSAGHEVRLITSYPPSRFPRLPVQIIHSCLGPEIMYRLARAVGTERWGEDQKMKYFGRAVAAALHNQEPNSDLFISWSSFGLEGLNSKRAQFGTIVRDSTHILHQTDVLISEYAKFGIKLPDPTTVLERELAEYQKADRILVLSEFARKTFIQRGISSAKVDRISLGVNTKLFRPASDFPALSPLRLLFFGTISFRKGIYYLLEGTKSFGPRIQLTLAGPVEKAFLPVLKRYSHVRALGAMSHEALGKLAREHHAYIFPSLEDGFPNTLIQAMASGLVPISTNECGPAEWIENGVNGFHITSQSAEAIEDSIATWLKHPELLKSMRDALLRTPLGHGWEDYQKQVVSWAQSLPIRKGRLHDVQLQG